MVVEVIKVHSNVSFELCLDEEFIELWWYELMFQSPHATNFCRFYTIQMWSSPVRWYHSHSVRRIWLFLLGCRGFKIVNLVCDSFKHCFEFFCEFRRFLIIVFLIGSHLLLVGLNFGLHDNELFIGLVIHLVASFWNIEAWGMKISITEIEQWLRFLATWRRWALMSK